jgi:FkbM family methyltransferase
VQAHKERSVGGAATAPAFAGLVQWVEQRLDCTGVSRPARGAYASRMRRLGEFLMRALTVLRRMRQVPGAVATVLRDQPPTSVRVVSYSGLDSQGIPLDLRLLHYLDRRNGFFIEAGANDGLFSSNTALLEEFLEWSGFLVEPAPGACELCRANRRVPVHNCALVSFDFQEDFVAGDFDGHPMASVGGRRLDRYEQYRVPARTLQAIIDEYGVDHVDFLSLDAEGYELEILRGIDFRRVTFSYILIELYPTNYEHAVRHLDEVGYELLASYSNYNKIDNPEWDGTHNDYVFARRGMALGES